MTRRAKQKVASDRLVLLVLLGTWCGAAMAAADFADPCPTTVDQSVTDLHDMLGNDKIITPVADTDVEPSEESEKNVDVGTKEEPGRNTDTRVYDSLTRRFSERYAKISPAYVPHRYLGPWTACAAKHRDVRERPS